MLRGKVAAKQAGLKKRSSAKREFTLGSNNSGPGHAAGSISMDATNVAAKWSGINKRAILERAIAPATAMRLDLRLPGRIGLWDRFRP